MVTLMINYHSLQGFRREQSRRYLQGLRSRQDTIRFKALERVLKPVNQDKPAGFADDEQAGLINQPDMVCGAAVPYGQKKQGEYTLEDYYALP